MAGATKTLYQKLQGAKKKHCAGKATAADVTAAANKYIADAVAKGKPKVEAQASAKAVKDGGCSVSGLFSRRKKPTAKRKRA